MILAPALALQKGRCADKDIKEFKQSVRSV